ncbi:hypothetical protein [Leptospira noguchii]|uniref:hypothetical protein n=1 Tax=Leptospira noguchii TaxID=28182 RepID=UPI0002F71640|nr:hypothetical protein [Leptospira noguchii]
MERKELNETLFTKAFETQHNTFLNSASRFYGRSGNSASRFYGRSGNSASRFYGRSTGREPVHYEICELRRRPVESRCT